MAFIKVNGLNLNVNMNKYDGLNPPVQGKEVASLIADSIYVEMQYSGHLILHEEPETYLKIIQDFLLEV